MCESASISFKPANGPLSRGLYDICPPFQFCDDSDYATRKFVSQHLRLRLMRVSTAALTVGAALTGGGWPGGWR